MGQFVKIDNQDVATHSTGGTFISTGKSVTPGRGFATAPVSVKPAEESKNEKSLGEQMKDIWKQMREPQESRTRNAISGAIDSGVSNYINLAGTAAEAAGKLNTRIANYQDAGKLETAQENAERYQTMLQRGKWADGRTMTEADRERVQKLLRRNQQQLANHKKATDFVEESNKAAAETAYQKADALTESSAEKIAKAKEGLGGLGQFAVDVGVGGTQLAGDILANTLLPGSGMPLMAARSFGGAAQEARQSGADIGQQVKYGAGSAAVSVLTEKLSNVAAPFKKAFGTGALDKALARVTEKPAGKILVSMLSEGGEEMLESAVQPLLQRLTYDPEAAYDEEWLTEMLYSGAVGAVLGGFGGGVDTVFNQQKNATGDAQRAKTEIADTAWEEVKEYVGKKPRNIEHPNVKSPNLSAENYLMPGENIETAYGNKYRKSVEAAAEKRLGLGQNHPAYLVASNVTKNGEMYFAKITRESLGKMLYTEKNQRLPVERLVLVDNIEKAFDNSVWASSEGDRKNRPQINGFDRLRTSFYIDGKPYYADIVVKVLQQEKQANSENVVYFLEPESIEVIKKVDAQSPTLERHAPKILFGDTASTNKTIPQVEKTVKAPYDITPQLETWEWEKQAPLPDITPKLSFDTIPAKSKKAVERTERTLVNRLADAMDIPANAQREYLRPAARKISEEYLKSGKVSEETLGRIFEDAYQQGIMVDEEYYNEYRELKDELRTRAVSISVEDSRNITDYGDFRKSAFGTLRISRNGTPVDILYQELSERYPNLFDAEMLTSAEMLERLYEVGKGIQKVERTLDAYYGEGAAEFKAWAKRDFVDAVEQTVKDLNVTRRYAMEAAGKQAQKMVLNPEMVQEAYDKIQKARRAKEKAMDRAQLTDHDKQQVQRLLQGDMTLDALNAKTDNVRDIRNVYEASKEYYQLAQTIKEYRNQLNKSRREDADATLGDLSGWKDKGMGFLYSRETMERNLLDIAPNKEAAQKVYDKYFRPVHTSNAGATRAKNDYRNRVRELNLSRKVQKGNSVSESYAVQFVGEVEDNIRILEENRKKDAVRDGKTLAEWKAELVKFWDENPNLDMEKIAEAIGEFHNIYDELYRKMNEARVRNGYEPIEYRKGYFPHFQEGGDGLLASFGHALGISTNVTSLPTSINGLTHTFKPGIAWFGNAQHRKGFQTEYDAVKGFDKYIEGAADVIYQTDNIQNLRALASQIRYNTTDEGIRKRVDAVQSNENLTTDQKDNEIRNIYKDGQYTLSNFAVELDEYTNLLANKKSRADRNMEMLIGRHGYNLMKTLEGRVAANMVAINPGSWLTNFIPITQGMASLNRRVVLQGMADTLKAYKNPDGIVEMSTFLTNRRGSDPIVKTLTQGLSAKMSSPMEYIDNFTADTLVRARYYQNTENGMSAADALNEADTWTAGVMADRSKGSMPTLFNRTNPLTKLFTQFQLEVNNQLSFVFKDLPREMKERGAKALTAALLKMFVGAWLYNEVYEYFVGRRSAMDPIEIINNTTGDLFGYEIPNLVELGGKAISGEEISAEDFQTEQTGVYDAIVNAGGQVAEQLPFIGGLLGGGRLPISSALPDVENLGKAILSEDWEPEKRKAVIAKELLGSPVTYLATPFGGGMLKKWVQGYKAMSQGGSYSVNAKGEKQLQYPVYTDTNGDKLSAALRIGLFGKSALPEAREWTESGFKSLGAKETSVYQGMTETGTGQKEAFEFLRKFRETEKEGDESEATMKRRMLRSADLSDDAKGIAYYGLLANDKEKEIMDGAAEEDFSGTAKALMNLKEAGTLKGTTATKAKRAAIMEANISDAEKKTLYSSFISEGKEDEINAVLEAGLSFNDWLMFEYKIAGISSDKSKTKKEKIVEIIQETGYTKEQKDALYLAEYKESGLKDTPWQAKNRISVPKLEIQGIGSPTINIPELRVPTLW